MQYKFMLSSREFMDMPAIIDINGDPIQRPYTILKLAKQTRRCEIRSSAAENEFCISVAFL